MENNYGGKPDALPVVAWLADKEAFYERLYDCGWRSIADAQGAGCEVLRTEIAEALATRDAELADLRAVSDACSNSLADKCREVVQLQAELDLMRKSARRWQDEAGALQAELAELRSASQVVLDGLNERIDYARDNRTSTPIFEGIADLHGALNAAPLVSDKAVGDAPPCPFAYVTSDGRMLIFADKADEPGSPDDLEPLYKLSELNRCSGVSDKAGAVVLLRRAVAFVEMWDDDSQEWIDLKGDIDNALALNPLAADVAQDGEACPECKGSGEGMRLSDSGPDAHEIECDCQVCGGAGTLIAAYEVASKGWQKEHEDNIAGMGERMFMRSGLATQTARAEDAERKLRAWETGAVSRLEQAQPVAADVVQDIAPGVKRCVAYLENRASEYANEYGSYDNDTGCTEFRNPHQEDYYSELHELADALRALLATRQKGSKV